MDTRLLRYFVAVAEERHFGRAAQRLHMAQPPLSQQIKQLEEQLGTQLLVRTTRKVDLTPAGEMLLNRGRLMLEELEQLSRDVQTVGRGALGVIRLGSTGSATFRLMPALIQASARAMPGLQLNVSGEMLTPQMVEALSEGRLDLAILRPPVRGEDIDYQVLHRDQLAVALPMEHPLALKTSLTLNELKNEKFICYPQTSVVHSTFIDACRKAGFAPHTSQVASETSTLLSFVASGLGIAMVPVSKYFPHDSKIVFRPLVNAPSVELAIAWKANNDSALVRNFLKLCTPLTFKEGIPEDEDSSD